MANQTEEKNHEIIVEMKNIDMRFQGVHALDDVSITLRRGQVHALMGENGAGKSTLMKILVGLYVPTKGEIYYKVKYMMVMENIYLGREPMTRTGCVDYQKMYEDSKRLLEGLGVDLDPKARMADLTVAKFQLVEIVKAISYDADVIIMDEPTSALSQTEIEYLLKTVRRLCDQGKAIVFISHKLEEVDGRFIHTGLVKDITEAEMIKYMVDREISEMYPKQQAKIGDVVLEVKNLTRAKEFENVSFTLRKGEILGLAGLMGAGRTEVVETIMGVRRPDSGEIYLNGEKIVNRIPEDAIRRGIIMVPEDRKKNGLVLKLGIRDNLLMSALRKCLKNGALNKSLETKYCKEFGDKLEIKRSGDNQLCANLSGGNQQKVVVARVLNADPDIIILDEPTRGIDVGAKYEIYCIINQLVAEGKSVIMISSELPEILGMCDRIYVMNEGKIVGELAGSEATQELIMSKILSAGKKGALA